MPNMESGIPRIVQDIETKSFAKQDVYHNTLEAFQQCKKVVQQTVDDLQEALRGKDHEVDISLEEPSTYELRLKIAGDIILFTMHSNVFNFDEQHSIHQSAYVKEDPTRAYCGSIQVYNFLADSFKFNRLTDLGYLIARVFLNKENHFFVEGHRQLGFLYNDFDNFVLNDIYFRAIVEACIQYSLDFDLIAPPFEATRQISVQAMQLMSMQAGWKTSKIPGYKLSFMDEDEENRPIG